MANVKSVRQNMETVTMDIGGRVRTLQYDMNAFAELENRFETVDAAMEQLGKGRITDIKTILWVGLIHEEAIIDSTTGEPTGYNITPYDVGSWIKNPSMLQEVSDAISKAMGFSSPDPADMTEEQLRQLKDQGIEIGEDGRLVVVDTEKAEKAKERKND